MCSCILHGRSIIGISCGGCEESELWLQNQKKCRKWKKFIFSSILPWLLLRWKKRRVLLQLNILKCRKGIWLVWLFSIGVIQCRKITCKSGISGTQREFSVCFLVPLIARCTAIRQQFSQFIVHYKIIGIIGGSSFSRCTFFSLYLSLYFIEAIKFFPVLSSLVFRVRCNQIDRNAFRNFWNEGIASKIVFRRYQYIWLTTTEQNTEAKRMNKSIWI